MRLYHDSRNEECRHPQGAICAGDSVRLRIFCEDEKLKVKLRVWNGKSEIHDMKNIGLGGFEYTVESPSEPCLLWYDFIIENTDGSLTYYGNADDKLGGEGRVYPNLAPSFQITCYDKKLMPPDYMIDGVMYQIFPDRFNRLSLPKSKREEVYIHQRWDELPLVDPDPRSGDNRAFDFFGGSLKGIEEKLPYLKDLGISVLYLNPIFKARSNHRYDTGDYRQIDPLLGTKKDFNALCKAAKKMGINVLLDGVFSHTGEDSRYFNRYGNYEGEGAYQSKKSPYFSWFKFKEFPDDYACWWNIPTLPEIDKDDDSYRDFIFSEDGVARHWIKQGASGWRLDVADELPMDFLRELRKSVKAQNKKAVLMGEVWEDASNKVSYGKMRSYCLGDTVDSVMNYPLREGLINFFCGKISAFRLVRLIQSLKENYPAPFFYALMNLLGSHDRARILNVLCDHEFTSVRHSERGKMRLPERQMELAKKRLIKMLDFIIALPGLPAIYYGDEIGMQGAADPFCRGSFTWDNMDEELLNSFKQRLKLRRERKVLSRGFLEIAAIDDDSIIITRFAKDNKDVFGNELSDAPYTVKITRDRFTKQS